MKNRIYPSDFEKYLVKYENSEHDKIRSEYNQIYDIKYKDIEKKVLSDLEKDITIHHKHEDLLSFAISPFLSQKPILANFELLFLEPLYFSRESHLIDENIPIFDFLIGEFTDDSLIRLYFGEVKGQTPKNLDSIQDFPKYYSQKDLIERVLDYIRKIRPTLNINFEDIEIEYILVVDSFDYSNFEASVNKRKLPLKIWEIKADPWEHKYHIDAHYKIDGSKAENRNYSKILNYFRDNDLEKATKIEFTYATDLTLILLLMKQEYVNEYGAEIQDNNLKELIDGLAGGSFYDDPDVIPKLVAKIKNKAIEMNLVKNESGKIYFKRIDFKKNLFEERMKSALEKESGSILSMAIDNIKPKMKILDKLLTKKSTESK